MPHRFIVTGRNCEISRTAFQDEATSGGLFSADGVPDSREVSAMKTARTTVRFLASVQKALAKVEARE